MYLDNPMSVAYEAAKTAHFGAHPLGNSILGTVESITGLEADQMRDYFARRYSPANIVLAFAGKAEWGALVELAEQPLRSLARRGVGEPRCQARSAARASFRAILRADDQQQTVVGVCRRARRWKAPTATPPTCWRPSSATTPARGSTGR